MCEKAKSIQEKRGNKNTWWKDGDYVYCMMYGERNAPENRIDVFLEYAFQDDHYDDMEFIWLPRLDQLQKLFGDYDKVRFEVLNFTKWFEGEMRAFSSMEQAWLAYYIHKVHNKVWNGEDWIKQG